MSGSLGEQEMLWEHEPQVSASFSQTFTKHGVNMFSISFRKHHDEKKETIC